jgi:hypothetical protein
MIQTTKSRHRNDPTAFARVLFCLTTGRRSLRQRKISSVIVVIPNVLVHQAFQMTLIQNNYMVEQIASGAKELSRQDRQKPQQVLHETSLQSVKLDPPLIYDLKADRYFGEGQDSRSTLKTNDVPGRPLSLPGIDQGSRG